VNLDLRRRSARPRMRKGPLTFSHDIAPNHTNGCTTRQHHAAGCAPAGVHSGAIGIGVAPAASGVTNAVTVSGGIALSICRSGSAGHRGHKLAALRGLPMIPNRPRQLPQHQVRRCRHGRTFATVDPMFRPSREWKDRSRYSPTCRPDRPALSEDPAGR
jgi:hypothetical protein